MFKLRYILYTGLLSLALIVAFNLSLIPNFFSKNNDEQKFLELLDKEFAKSIEDNPIYASYMGDLRFNTLWPDYSIEKINKRLERIESEFSYKSFFDFIIVNDKVEKATNKILNIIYKETKGVFNVS